MSPQDAECTCRFRNVYDELGFPYKEERDENMDCPYHHPKSAVQGRSREDRRCVKRLLRRKTW